MAYKCAWGVDIQKEDVDELIGNLVNATEDLLEEEQIRLSRKTRERLAFLFAKELKLRHGDYKDNVTLTFVKIREYDGLPMYVDEFGQYWIDVQAKNKKRHAIYDCENGDFENGEPDEAFVNYFGKGIKFTFVPERIILPEDAKVTMYGL